MALEHHWTVIWKNKSHVWSLQKMTFFNLIRSIKDKEIKEDLISVCEKKQLPEELGSSNGTLLFLEDRYALVGHEVRWKLFNLSTCLEVGSSFPAMSRTHKDSRFKCWLGSYDPVLRGSLMAIQDGEDLWYGAVGYRLGDFSLLRVGDVFYLSDKDPIDLLQSYVEQSLPADFLEREEFQDHRFNHVGGTL